MMIILGIDPGEHAGWGKYINGEYDSSDAVRGDSALIARDILIAEGPDVVVIEDQHPGAAAWGRLRTLMYHRYLWEVAAELQGIRVEPVNASTWQGYFKLRKGKNSPKMSQQYGPLASALIGRDVFTDEAAAVLIACWGSVSFS